MTISWICQQCPVDNKSINVSDSGHVFIRARNYHFGQQDHQPWKSGGPATIILVVPTRFSIFWKHHVNIKVKYKITSVINAIQMLCLMTNHTFPTQELFRALPAVLSSTQLQATHLYSYHLPSRHSLSATKLRLTVSMPEMDRISWIKINNTWRIQLDAQMFVMVRDWGLVRTSVLMIFIRLSLHIQQWPME